MARSALNYFKSFFSITAQQSFIKSCREQLVINGLESKYFKSSSEYLTVFGEQVNQSGTFLQYLSIGLVAAFSVGLYLIFGLIYAPKEMIFSLSTTLIIMIPIKKMTFKIQAIGESLINEWSQVNENVLVAKKNLFFLTVYNLVQRSKNEIKENLNNYEKNYVSYASVVSIISSVPLFVGLSVLSVCTFISVEHFHTDGIKILSFFYVFLRLVQGLSELNSILAALKLSHPFFKNVSKVLNDISKIQLENSSSLSKNYLINDFSNPEIRFQSVAFAYPNELPLYENIEIDLKIRDVLVVKGASGSGKSTLLKLLLGLEKPTAGDVYINEIKVEDLHPCWKLQLGYVGPDPYLIMGSIRENLNFGNFEKIEFTDNEYWEALSMAELQDCFKENKINLNTILSELSFLSTGQRQRLSLARAFLRQPRIVILDEATANLDEDSEGRIVEKLKVISKNSIIIVVTHKNSFDKIATKFINIEKSRDG